MIESLNKTYPGIDALKWVDARTIGNKILKIEHPQTIAVCLGQMEAGTGQRRVGAICRRICTQMSLQTGDDGEVQPDVLTNSAKPAGNSVGFDGHVSVQLMSVGGAELMADILTRVDKNTEGAIMPRSKRIRPLADSIRALMFVFDDLVGLIPAMQELMKEIARKILPVRCRRHTGNQEKFLKNMSSRAAEMLKEDGNAWSVKVSDVENPNRTFSRSAENWKKKAGSSWEAVEARRCCRWAVRPWVMDAGGPPVEADKELSPRVVLIVDDEPAICLLLAEILRDTGHPIPDCGLRRGGHAACPHVRLQS